MLEVIQTWALAFEGRPHLSYVKSIYNKLKLEGIKTIQIKLSPNTLGLQFPAAAAVTASFVDSSAVPIPLQCRVLTGLATRMG